MARTRAKGGVTATTSASKPPTLTKRESRYTLAEEMDNPPQLFVLPRAASSGSRVVTLQNPRWSKPTRYLVCPDTGFYEFTRIAAPSSTPRSWLIDGARAAVKEAGDDDDAADVSDQTSESFQTHIAKDGEIFVATPYDPLFLVLPALASDAGKKRMFLSSDDHIDKLSETSPHLPQILREGKTRTLLEARMAAVCDTVEAGDETMFRLNESKLLGELVSKARRLTLPPSMEEKFVSKALEAPVLTRRSQPQPTPGAETLNEETADTPMTEKTESQASISSVETSDSATTQASASTAATTPSADPAEEEEEAFTAAMVATPEVLALQRLRVAVNFIASTYLPPSLAQVVRTSLAAAAAAADSGTDFAPLDDYLSQLAKVKQEVIAARAATDYSRKRGLDDIADERAEKKRRKEEEEKRKKAGESRGVKNLKKVNVSGMKKMSDFFKKKT